MLAIRVTVFPDVGGFPPASFDHLRHLEVHLPGLDPGWAHTLIDAQVAAGGGSADLTLHSQPRVGVALDRGLRIVTWQPAAHIRALAEDGTELAVTKLDAPLQVGQRVEVAGERHRVVEESWPGRHPRTGVCHEGLDYQHVTLVLDPEPLHHPTADQEATQ